MKLFIYPYKQGSASAKALSEALGAKRIKLNNSRHRWSHRNIIINWGSGSCPYEEVVNAAGSVRLCSNKLAFFQSLSEGSPIPEYTTSRETASEWILGGSSVCCRTILTGHSGAGLIIADNVDQLVNAPLYTKYVKKKDEYRIHLYKKDGQTMVFHMQRKGKREGYEDVNWRIRSHANGFNFVIGDCNPPYAVLNAARDVFDQTHLDFGAVDVGYNERNDSAVVYEINTAPGLEGTTLRKYVEMFRSLL